MDTLLKLSQFIYHTYQDTIEADARCQDTYEELENLISTLERKQRLLLPSFDWGECRQLLQRFQRTLAQYQQRGRGRAFKVSDLHETLKQISRARRELQFRLQMHLIEQVGGHNHRVEAREVEREKRSERRHQEVIARLDHIQAPRPQRFREGDDLPLGKTMDYVGNDFDNVPARDVSECFDICKEWTRFGCSAFTWTNHNGGTCWLKTGKGQVVRKKGAISGSLYV